VIDKLHPVQASGCTAAAHNPAPEELKIVQPRFSGPRSSKYNWKGKVPKVLELCACYFFRGDLDNLAIYAFDSQFAALYLFHGRSKRKAQLGI
jgi:hypothetical protein